ncbi:MAG: hypothetical protein ACLP59_25745 [Bryobacteraceae bacterium]
MRIERVIRHFKEFAMLPMDRLQKLMDVAEMVADVKAYNAAKGRLARNSAPHCERRARAPFERSGPHAIASG